MSRFTLFRHLLASAGGGLLTPNFYTGFGTATDANGWITFDLKPGCRRVWVDSNMANDTGNGLTAATAKKTLNAAWLVFTNGSWTAGDQLMFAGTGGRTYTDGTGSSSTIVPGFSTTYPTAFLSYDPADAANSAKYGKLVGPDMPSLTYVSVFNVVNIDGRGNVAVQGLNLTAPTSAGGGISVSSTASHPGICYQNCRLSNLGWACNPGSVAQGANQHTMLISKSSLWGGGGIFCAFNDGLWVQDVILVHCSWTVGCLREDTYANGGITVFSHNVYYHATNVNGRWDRVVTVDSPLEGIGQRGDTEAMTQIVSIDNAVGLGAGGFSGNDYTEAPLGVRVNYDDVVVMGSDIADNSLGGWAVEWDNTVPGSYIRNCALFDNTTSGSFGTSGNYYAEIARVDSRQISQELLCDKWSGWNYATHDVSHGGTDMAHASHSWSNCILDINPAAWNGTAINCSQRLSAPSGYKTRTQTYAAMGFSSKAAMVNAMLYRPDLQWAPAICSISLPAMGLTPQFAITSPPDMTGMTPTIVYPTTLSDLTISSLNFTRGVGNVVLLSGLSAYSYLSCADLPTGFSLSTVDIAYSTATGKPAGAVTSGSNQIVANDVTGMTPGMYIIALASDLVNALFPAGTYILSISGSTLTVSNNATGTNATSRLNVNGGGRALRYDGSGSGAATPTIHIVENSKDTLGTHTTPFTLSIT